MAGLLFVVLSNINERNCAAENLVKIDVNLLLQSWFLKFVLGCL